MFIPYRLLKNILTESGHCASFLRYFSELEKGVSRRQRILFLTKCLQNDLIPRFLRFRVPENGCFERTIVHNFQKRLLRKEISVAKSQLNLGSSKVDGSRNALKDVPSYLVPSIVLYSRLEKRIAKQELDCRHGKKLLDLSIQQEKPLRTGGKTVVVIGEIDPP